MSSGSYGPPGLEKSSQSSSGAFSAPGGGIRSVGAGNGYGAYAYGYNPYMYAQYAYDVCWLISRCSPQAVGTSYPSGYGTYYGQYAQYAGYYGYGNAQSGTQQGQNGLIL